MVLQEVEQAEGRKQIVKIQFLNIMRPTSPFCRSEWACSFSRGRVAGL